MAGYVSPIDVADRALQHMGQGALSSAGFQELSVAGVELSAAYDKVRRRELRRSLWTCSTRRARLYPIDVNTLLFTPGYYSPTVPYSAGAVVQDAVGSYWTSPITNNLGQPLPTLGNNSPVWDVYFGPLTVDPWQLPGTPSGYPNVPSAGYSTGDLVYLPIVGGSYAVYRSLINGNMDDPATPDAWSATNIYYQSQVVSYNNVLYQSNINGNLAQTPGVGYNYWSPTLTNPSIGSSNWVQMFGATLSPLLVTYPLGSGPASDANTSNLFHLPNGFMRHAPTAPKAGITGSLWGASSGPQQEDWELEGKYLISFTFGPILMRFVADIQDVTQFDDMFCEGLALALADGTVMRITGDPTKKAAIVADYKVHMMEARLVDAIEAGPTMLPQDEYITVRY